MVLTYSTTTSYLLTKFRMPIYQLQKYIHIYRYTSKNNEGIYGMSLVLHIFFFYLENVSNQKI